VLLALGSSTVPVADRALVVAVVPRVADEAVPGAVARAVADGADVVEVPSDAVELAAGVPVAVRTPDAVVAREAFAAGAVLALDPSGFADPGYLPAAVLAGATVVGAAPVADAAEVVPAVRALVRRAADAGLPADRLAVEPVPPAGGPLALPPAPALRCTGVPVLVSVVRPDAADPDPGAVAGALSVAAVRGCGLLRVAAADVRSARRVADVVAAVRRGRQ
jgi:dihydropteroate synthase